MADVGGAIDVIEGGGDGESSRRELIVERISGIHLV
jgi:hypothetical protein